MSVPIQGGGEYCIDATEVTNVQYETFVAVAGTSGQITACTGNTTFTPSASCSTGDYDPQFRPHHPVTCVDWCDAYAYCAWAGKRLCGGIGGATLATTDFDDTTKSEWFNACSKGGSRQFPYGNTYIGDWCWGLDIASSHTTSVSNVTTCQGGYTGLFHLSGNAWEWENSCSSDQCTIRGGGWLQYDVPGSSGFTLRCNSAAAGASNPSPPLANRMSVDRGRGFRCCAD
ncbi:MAG: SUMF1/EgtB/PvdO family nonheme iron enzyme [Polyangiaceae bacterium]|nr:SUMF1/EgtB/PvdO family nonheme iron enzyme [Polyangiaceae bacterium]